MSVTKVQCKVCGEWKSRYTKEGETKGNGRKHYYTYGKRWMGKVCPLCIGKYQRQRRGQPEKLPKIRCYNCENLFTPRNKVNVTCSDRCRKAREVRLSYHRKKHEIKDHDMYLMYLEKIKKLEAMGREPHSRIGERLNVYRAVVKAWELRNPPSP